MDIEDQVVRHICDVPACVRPDHLRVGTVADNNADMVARGRHAKRERHGSAKLTRAEVFTMRCLRIATSMTYQQIADQFGVGKATARSATTGQTWGRLSW